ncbi:tRNA 2-thiouridine(34) synthase MnmA [Calditerrivibrio nitroreducens]|uniref:tRNA-specific 2-thiouridylase MnmA n=1 Tax=Calditerrivibrio nitroreducens (strain DSM 19672 / NBRC 101217 / Yu37-1) TaxID=768670 RepID=E4TGZ7_CALNY|nr:tRNA 2-thiouridine(34) synthase MnmA [Calditerrivibrio nitroreducens]ADR19795.1 tRNA(5-methylaminomethyl-2-thiouridylate)-methyl transferase [Calditerrivibrio nitroreducens DSM 19672]
MKRVVVAMSGGVDSSVTAYILKKMGYDVVGVTIKMFENQEKYLKDAEAVAKKLDIKWEMIDKTIEFQETVISYFINSYRKGLTPNPCAYCNRNAKFFFLYNEMLKYGADHIATGHYADIVEVDGHKYIKKSTNTKKDQSYYLALIRDDLLDKLLFPLGMMDKSEVRKIASSIGLEVAEKKDSQEVCFLEGGDYRDYLKKMIDPNKIKKGYFIYNNERIMKHEGIEFYTVGQRRGLGIGYHKPLYVQHIDPVTFDIHLTDENRSGYRGVRLNNCNWFGSPKKLFRAQARLRYRMKDANTLVEILPDDRADLLFDEPQPFPAPGQVAAIYNKDILLGGGFIEGVF